MLAKEQYIGATILFGGALLVWFIVAFWPSDPKEPQTITEMEDTIRKPYKHYRSWEERKDSMRRVDSIRYAQWAIERQQRYDSAKRADSLWRDSVGWRFAKRIKKDTILDLNHTDTTELQFIRGIGRYTATQIVRYGEQLGGYYSPSQLTDEPLAKLGLDTLLAHFTADAKDVTVIHVNRCSAEMLNRHPYIRFAQAKAIYTLRRKQIALHSLDELRALPELSEEDLARLAPYLSFD